MNQSKAYEIIERAKPPMLREFGVALIQDEPFSLIYIPYEEISDLSLYLINQETFATELPLREKNGKISIIKEGLDNLMEKVKKRIANENSKYSNFSRKRGILEYMSADYSSSHRSEKIFHTHQCSYPWYTEHIKNETLNEFVDSTDSYFLSWKDIVFARQGGMIFLPLDYERLNKTRTQEELEQEKRAAAERMKNSEVKGFYIKVEPEQQCPTCSVPEWLDFLLQNRGWYKPRIGVIVEG